MLSFDDKLKQPYKDDVYSQNKFRTLCNLNLSIPSINKTDSSLPLTRIMDSKSLKTIQNTSILILILYSNLRPPNQTNVPNKITLFNFFTPVITPKINSHPQVSSLNLKSSTHLYIPLTQASVSIPDVQSKNPYSSTYTEI